ncbi:mas-related G-protein coupled receptor member D-like [Echinops telfairi]|uniref:Mas-related G-protein coupled receptor member D-like n=1 Tax=Echinops telfairi TaxID=9371 RepID=A0ABM0J363_ECHTE|nr:mas-related G-protein coupled receptor member D-like [Echinops telfairi]
MNRIETSEPTPKATTGTDVLSTDYVVMHGVVLLTCGCGTLGNGWVIWLLAFRVRRNPFCVYVLNLAVADLLFLVCQISVVGSEIIFLVKDTEATEMLQKVKYSAYMMSMSLLVTISLQRCLGVLFPMWYRLHRPQHMSSGVCALLWGLYILVDILMSFLCNKFRDSSQPWCSTLKTIGSVLILGVFTPLMMLSSLVLFVHIRRSSRQWHRRAPRVLMVILASVLVFLVFSVPYVIHWLAKWMKVSRWVENLHVSILRLSMSLSSSANPIIYILAGRKRTQSQPEALGAMLDRALQETCEGSSKETSSIAIRDMVSEAQPPSVTAPVSPALEISLSTRL